MGPRLDILLVAIILGGFAAWVVWGFISWFRKRPLRLSATVACSLVGFSCASASAALEIGSGVYAQFIGGFPFNHPTLLRIYALGLLFAAVGLILGLVGALTPNPLRWKAPSLSAVFLLLWVGQVIGE